MKVRWKTHLNNVSLILATPAFKRVLFEVCNGNQSTAFTDMNPVCITLVKKPLFQEVRSTMGNHAVSLHLPKSKTTITRSPLSRLPRKNLYRASSTRMDLVINHVLQSLVVRWPQEYHKSEHSSCVPIVHGLKPTHLITTFVKCLADIVHL